MSSSKEVGSLPSRDAVFSSGSNIQPVSAGTSANAHAADPAGNAVANDAVLISLSSDKASTVPNHLPGVKSDEEKEAAAVASHKPISEEEANDLADTLKKALNRIQGTIVQFDVSIQQSGASTLSFQVIDTNSGEVIRQFPPEKLYDLKEKTDNFIKHQGVLIDSAG